MNKHAIVILYSGNAQDPGYDTIEGLANVIVSAQLSVPELIEIKHFDSDSIGKAIIAKASNISFTEDTTESRIIEEARTKAIQLIKSKYSGATGHISLTRDIVMARYHHHANDMNDDERTLLDAIEVIMDIPQKRLNTLLPKATREVIFTTRDL